MILLALMLTNVLKEGTAAHQTHIVSTRMDHIDAIATAVTTDQEVAVMVSTGVCMLN